MPSSSAGAGGYQGGDAAYTALVEGVERDLRKLSATVSGLKKLCETVGTRAEAGDTREKIDANVRKGKDLVKSLGGALKTEFSAFVSRSDVSARDASTRRTQHNRFMADYKAAVEAFSAAANAAAAAERRYPPPAETEGSGRRTKQDEEEARMMASLQQMDLTESLMSEREAQIDDIAAAVVEVNEVFRDLAQLVEQQGEDIDRVEVNVSDAKDKTESGLDHLHKASEYQKRSRTLIIVILLIIVIVAGSLTAYFLVSKK